MLETPTCVCVCVAQYIHSGTGCSKGTSCGRGEHERQKGMYYSLYKATRASYMSLSVH